MENRNNQIDPEIDWYAFKLANCKEGDFFYKIAHSPYANPEYLHENPSHCSITPYYISMPSKNRIIRFLDWCCSLEGGYNNYSVMVVILSLISQLVGWVIPVIICICSNNYNPHLFLCIGDMPVAILGFIYAFLSVVFRIDLVYRHYRNKYLDKHNLPGPYGWGSIDKDKCWY